MRIHVSTGHSKALEGTYLMPILLGEEKGERVVLLLHTQGKDGGSGSLKEECESVLTHSVLEAEGNAYDRLESALKELNGLLKGFQLSDAISEIHAIVGLLETDGNFHLSHVGRAEAYLVRNGAATQITEYARGKQPVAFLHIVSGPLEPGDSVILSTQRLLRTVTPAQLAQTTLRSGSVLNQLVADLDSEKETACLAHIAVAADAVKLSPPSRASARTPISRNRSGPARYQRGGPRTGGIVGRLSAVSLPALVSLHRALHGAIVRLRESGSVSRFLSDLSDPHRKRRAHLLLLAGVVILFLVLWMFVQLSLSTQKSQTKGELAALIEQIESDIKLADNRELAGEAESANVFLKRAEDRARQIMGNESGLFRSDALNLLDRIRSKREEMNNIIRIPPRVAANLSSEKADVVAQGLIGISDGEFFVYDRQDVYRVLLNSVDKPSRLNTEELIVDGAPFLRFQSQVFLTTGNSLIEFVNGQATIMKTEDPGGWMTGADIETYLKYLYILSPEQKQIYKYEHLSGRFGPAAEYNVNGDLTGAIDMTITGPVYVLREIAGQSIGASGRTVTKLLRGEKQNFVIRNLPAGALDGTTKIFKSSANGNFYFLDPVGKRVIVATSDDDLGDALYLRQYILEGEQVGKLQSFYVDPEDTRLYVLDEKRLYVIELKSSGQSASSQR